MNTEAEIVFDIEYLYSQFELLGDEEEALAYWLTLLNMYQDAGQYDECHRLLRFIKSVHLSPSAMGHVYQAVGDLLRQQGRWDDAATAYNQALALFHELDQTAARAGVLNDYALTLQEQQQYVEAEACYQQAVALYESLADAVSQGHVYANLGSMAYERGHWHEAIEHYQRAVALLEQNHAPDDLASIYNNLGVAYENLGDLETAERHYMRCVDLLDATEAAYSKRGIRILNNLGQLYGKRNQIEKAIPCFESALLICQEIDNSYEEMTTRNNMGAVYLEQGQHENAVSCFQQSARLAQQLDDRQNQALSLSNMGAAYADGEALELAATCYQNSLLLSEELGDQYGIVRAYNNLGALAAHQGDQDPAIAYYEKAADAAHAIGYFYRETMTLTNIASLYAQAYRSELADHYFERAWSIAETQDYYDHLAALCTLRGDVAFAHQQTYPEAYKWFARACRYAIRHSPQTFQQIMQHVDGHLQRLQRRNQGEVARAFALVLLNTWQGETLTLPQSEYRAMLHEIVALPDSSADNQTSKTDDIQR